MLHSSDTDQTAAPVDAGGAQVTEEEIAMLRDALVAAHSNVESFSCYADPHNLQAKRDALQQLGWAMTHFTKTAVALAATIARAELVQKRREKSAILAFVARVYEQAEADILAGNPIEGAHYRALQAEVSLLEVNV